MHIFIMFPACIHTKYEKNPSKSVGVVDYTLQCENAAKMTKFKGRNSVEIYSSYIHICPQYVCKV